MYIGLIARMLIVRWSNVDRRGHRIKPRSIELIDVWLEMICRISGRIKRSESWMWSSLAIRLCDTV